MKERPILFSASMVRAILEGRKTMTRRVIKYPLSTGAFVLMEMADGSLWPHVSCDGESLLDNHDNETPMHCPYGQPGDRLWVRETFRTDAYADGRAEYRASPTCEEKIEEYDSPARWRPSIFMQRKYSRILLDVTAIRVERVQDISEADARDEGSSCTLWYQPFGKSEGESVNLSTQAINPVHPSHGKPEGISYRNGFASLWDSINAKRGYGWDANLWVWVVEFKSV